MKIVRDSAVRQEPAQPQAVSPEENRFSIRPRQIALFFLWMLAFTLLARGTSGALLPEVQLSTPAPNTITQSLTATGTIQWAAGSLFYLPEGLLVEAVFVSEGEAVQEGDKIAALRREDVEQKLRSLQAELAQKQTEYARLTKPVAADSYDLEKAQQALQAAYQAAENSAAAWAEKEANAGSERDALQRELNERQEKAAQYAREIAEKQAQRELLQQEESPDEEIISRIEAELTQLTAEETQNREALPKRKPGSTRRTQRWKASKANGKKRLARLRRPPNRRSRPETTPGTPTRKAWKPPVKQPPPMRPVPRFWRNRSGKWKVAWRR